MRRSLEIERRFERQGALWVPHYAPRAPQYRHGFDGPRRVPAGGGGGGGITFGQTWSNSTLASSCTVSVAPAADDFLIGCGVTDAATANDFQTPSGFTLAYQNTSTNDGMCFGVFYKKATGSETSVVFATNSSNTCIASVSSYKGVHTSTPLDVAIGTFQSNSPATTTDISITPVTNGAMIVMCNGVDAGNANYTYAYSTTAGSTGAWTVRVDINSTYWNIGSGSALQTTAGALTARCTSTSGGRVAVLFALRPA